MVVEDVVVVESRASFGKDNSCSAKGNVVVGWLADALKKFVKTQKQPTGLHTVKCPTGFAICRRCNDLHGIPVLNRDNNMHNSNIC